MKIKASGRSALILATGILVCFAGPSQAATGTDNDGRKREAGELGARCAEQICQTQCRTTGKSYAHRKSSTVAQKPSDNKEADKKAG